MTPLRSTVGAPTVIEFVELLWASTEGTFTPKTLFFVTPSVPTSVTVYICAKEVQAATSSHKQHAIKSLVIFFIGKSFQLVAGRYRVEVYAVDALKRRSNVIKRRIGLTLRPPRGALHAYTVPAWPSLKCS